MSADEVKGILFPLLSGLEEVHAAGYLHRDIKPGNIVIRDDGSPVLIDFGAARQAVGARSRSVTSIVTPGRTCLRSVYPVERSTTSVCGRAAVHPPPPPSPVSAGFFVGSEVK